jgi:lipoprotein-anchoring transpeptidase ErfK/SrfK
VSRAYAASALAVAACAAAWGHSAPPATASTGLAIVNHAVVAHAAPNRASARVSVVSATRPLTASRTILPVVARVRDGRGTAWLRVLLPGRPNGRSGWILARPTTPASTAWRIVVHLSTRRITVLRDGRRARTVTAVVGATATPTPRGRFFVEEVVTLDRREAGAPFALALSARSNVLQEFAGGPGQIALHGTRNIGGVPGTAVSHGCLRVATGAIVWLAGRIGPGTLVTIER